MKSAIFSCREASRLASEALDHPLSMRQRMSLRMHTMMCAACTTYIEQISLIDHLFRDRALSGKPDLPISDSLDAAARERIRAKLRANPV